MLRRSGSRRLTRVGGRGRARPRHSGTRQGPKSKCLVPMRGQSGMPDCRRDPGPERRRRRPLHHSIPGSGLVTKNTPQGCDVFFWSHLRGSCSPAARVSDQNLAYLEIRFGLALLRQLAAHPSQPGSSASAIRGTRVRTLRSPDLTSNKKSPPYGQGFFVWSHLRGSNPTLWGVVIHRP